MPRIRIQLPNGCSRSEISVTPKNWKSVKKIKGPWRIHYRFYDPTQPVPKQVTDKTMNKYGNVESRKAVTELCLETLEQILGAGYNPFLSKVVEPQKETSVVEPTTLFIPALKIALGRVSLEAKTRKEIERYIIGNVSKAAIQLGYDTLYINEVRRRHIVFILDHLRKMQPAFTDNTFNHFRKYLRILFEELTEIDAVESNIIKDIKKKAVEGTTREVLTDEQRTFINNLLLTRYPEFHRFLHIFFHSGARITELMKVKGVDVELEEQRYKVTIMKGRKPRTVWRTIKNIAMPYWRQAIEECGADDYVFSVGLKPGEKKIQSYQITKRWYRLIKCKEFEIGGNKQMITADFYSLKHLNTTETIDHLEHVVPQVDAAKLAAEHNAHTSSAMVVSIYDVKQKKRTHDKVKRVNNPFA